MDEGYHWLKAIADQMKSDVKKGARAKPERLTVRQLLQRFGYQRRGDWINNHIRNGFEKFGLHANKDFRFAWVDSEIAIELDSGAPGSRHVSRMTDPTLRVGILGAAHKKPTSVKPESPLTEATTKMQLNDYSRLPVMKNEREVVGIVTWESIGARLALGCECRQVNQCMVQAEVISIDTRLFDAISRISDHEYVLVQAADKVITGIGTATDLSHLLKQLAGPFLLIGEIEGHLRNFIHGKFTLDQLQAAAGEERLIEGSADLTLGGYQRLLGNKDNWARLKLCIDRKEFIAHLDFVRRIRNEVMHFNPDGLDEDRRTTLRNVARFFDQLAGMTVE